MYGYQVWRRRFMDIWAIILNNVKIAVEIIIGITTIIASIVQAIDFIRKRRKKKQSENLSSHADVVDKTSGESKESEQLAGVVHKLPPRNEFIGRKGEIEIVHKALLSRPHIICIDGVGGVGKTSLVLEVAHECLAASKSIESNNRIATFKGFIYITTKGHDLSLDNMLDEVAEQLERDIEMRQLLKRQLLQEKRSSTIRIFQNNPCLLIVDGYETITDTAVEDFLLELPEPSKVLITTRKKTVSSARIISLNGLPDLDAIEFVRSYGESQHLREIVNAGDTQLLLLCKATEGNPLAIQWALGQIGDAQQSLDATLGNIEKNKGNTFEQIFLISWGLLSQDARRILRIMPIFKTDAFKQSIEVVSRLFRDDFNIAMRQLTKMSLINTKEIQEASIQRYSIHPLTQEFILAKLITEPETAYYANKDLALFLEEYTQKHGGLWNLQGFERLKSDILNIIPIIRWCWQENLIELGVSIFDNIRYFIVNYGLWNTALELALDAIKLFPVDVDELPSQLTTWQTKVVIFRIWPIAWIYRFRGDYDSAKKEITLAIKMFTKVGDNSNVAMAKRHLGLVVQKVGEMESAKIFFKEALDFAESKQDIYRVQLLTADLADLALQQGNLDEAWELSQIVIETPNHIKDRQCTARFYRVLGSVARQRKEFIVAKELCKESLKHTEGLQYLDGIADTSFELAQIEMEMGEKDEAQQKYEQAHTIYKTLGMDYKAREIEDIFAQLQEKANE